MQKKLIALAVAGLVSGGAFAQSNVTIYGVVDAALTHSTGDDATGASRTRTGIDSGNLSGSRLGFKGSEDLGGGLKAVFTLEYSLTVDVNSGVGNTGGLNSRQTWVGLQSKDLGTLSFGRQYAPGFFAMARTEALGAGLNDPVPALQGAGKNTIMAASPARWNNTIAYQSNNYSGFSGRVVYSFGETALAANSNSDNRQYGIGLNYASGPLDLEAVWHSRSIDTAAVGGVPGPTPQGDDVNEWMLGGTYNFGIAKLWATYQSQDDKNDNAGVTEISNKIWQLAVSAPVGRVGNVQLSYAKLNWDKGDADSKAYGLGYTHTMSKRTALYATWIHVDNDAAPLGGTFNPAGIFLPGAADETSNHLFLGIRHMF